MAEKPEGREDGIGRVAGGTRFEIERGFDRPSLDDLPVHGRLLWVVPGEGFREVVHPAVSPPEVFDRVAENGSSGRRPCSNCDGETSVEVVLREHAVCGHVDVDGFVDDRGRFVCPSCETVVSDTDEIDVVGTAYSCLFCGELFDRPIRTSSVKYE